MPRILTFRRERLAVTTLALSILCHGMAYWLVERQLRPLGLEFVPELLVFLLLSQLISVAVFLVDDQRYFRALQGLGAAFVFVAVRIVATRSLAIELLLLAPLIAETGIYEPPRVAVPASGLLVAAVLAFDAAAPGGITGDGPTRLALALLATIVLVSGVSLLTHYRERIVENAGTIGNLATAFDNLADANLGLQLYATHAGSESAGKERNRITRELHDSIGYAMTNVAMMMSAGKVLLRENPEGLPDLLDATRRLSEECLQETRKTLYRLRSLKNGHLQGIRALSHLVTAFRAATGIDVEFHHGNVPWSLGEEADAVLYRLVQEGLTNAFRHGKASQIRIALWMDQRATQVRIWDNGQGAASIHEGIGLSGMRERIRSIGGSVEPRNTLDGFELRAELPSPPAGSAGE